MSEVQYNVQFEKVCRTLQLGEIVGMPESISGGLLHKMYAIATKQGKYAIKALNPQIMIRPTAKQNLIRSEQIANVAANRIAALPAKTVHGSFLHEIDNQYYLVFDWIEGRSLKPGEIHKVHCEKIGAIVAEIHSTDFSEIGIMNDSTDHEQLTDWKYYLHKGQEFNAVWVNLLLGSMDQLYDWNDRANKAAKQLASDTVISHRDLDPKNVMWNQDTPILIDWESAGCINPMQDLTETAIYWSEDEKGNIDKERFRAFISGYKQRYGKLEADWGTVLANGFSGKLGWLEYSMKRSLWMECTSEEEQRMGTDQVTGTIHALRRYADQSSELVSWFIDQPQSRPAMSND